MKEDVVKRAAVLVCFDDPREIKPIGGGIPNVNLYLRDGQSEFVVRLGNDVVRLAGLASNNGLSATALSVAELQLTIHLSHGQNDYLALVLKSHTHRHCHF